MRIFKKIWIILILLFGTVINIIKADTVSKIRTIDFLTITILGFGIGVLFCVIIGNLKKNK